jgi:hypothetical protein
MCLSAWTHYKPVHAALAAFFPHRLLIDCRLIDQHDGNLIANRIKPVAGNTPQPAAIGLQFHFRPAGGTNQDLEEFCAYSHLYEALVYQFTVARALSLPRRDSSRRLYVYSELDRHDRVFFSKTI